MSRSEKSVRATYPGKVAIRHAIEGARHAGIDVAGFTIRPDGTITILDARAAAPTPPTPESEYDRLVAAGIL